MTPQELFAIIDSPAVSLGAGLVAIVALLWLGLRTLVNPPRGCDCPRHLLERQDRGGMVWKTRHRIDCLNT
jgi:hypothetical protein